MSNHQTLPKIKLRAMEPEDLDVLYKIENDTSLWGEGVTNVPYSRYTLHDYIANEQGQTVGIIDITDFDPRHRRAELGVVIQCQHRGKGYAKAAILEVIAYAREILHLHQLYLYVDTQNVISLEIFKKSGFTCSAELKDWLLKGENYKNAVLMQYFL